MDFMARFRHPYAVRLLDASLDDPKGPCIIMEYIPGLTLETLLERQGRLGLGRVGKLLGQLCQVLQAAHKVGIIHQDLKPANIMVVEPNTPAEKIKVMDFGLAKLDAKPHIPLEKLTDPNFFSACGTPDYIPPEAVRGDEVDHRGDIYSVGVMLYEMLTGKRPFDFPEVTGSRRSSPSWAPTSTCRATSKPSCSAAC
jgi:serine/threonine-protein kinase